MSIDICTCGCEDAVKPEACPDCGGPVFTEWSPSIQGRGYGHRGFVCDSVICGWWDA